MAEIELEREQPHTHRRRRGLRFSLRLRALLTMGLLASFSAFVVWTTLISYFRDDKATYVKDFALDIATNKAMTLELQLERQLEILSRAGTEIQAGGDPALVLESGLRASPDAVFLALYGDDGGLRSGFARSDLLEMNGVDPDVFEASRRQLEASTRYLRAVGLVLENTTTTRALPLFAVMLPIRVEVTQEVLILRAEIRADSLLRALAQRAGFDLLVLDRNGDVFAHHDHEMMLPAHRLAAIDLLGQELMTALGRPGAGSGEYGNDAGEVYLAAHAEVELGGLDVVARRPLADAYLAADRLRDRSARAGLGIIALTVIIAILASRMLTGRLAELARAARRLKDGDFDVRSTSRGNDEIGDLATSFELAALGLKERDARLHETHAQLMQSEKLSSFGRFSAGIVHEVKNPLSAIGMSAELALTRVDDPVKVKKYLEVIHKETLRSNDILQSLLGFTRSDDETFAPLEVNDLIREVSQIMSPQIRKAGVELEQDLRASRDVIRGDRNGLTQVLMNLSLNAVDAMQDSERKRVRIETENGDDEVVIRVADTGPGIPDEVRHKIFEPFYTSKPKGKGTGLGLYVSYTIVDKHGGRIEITNRPDAGAVFHLRFPLLVETEKDAPDAAETGELALV